MHWGYELFFWGAAVAAISPLLGMLVSLIWPVWWFQATVWAVAGAVILGGIWLITPPGVHPSHSPFTVKLRWRVRGLAVMALIFTSWNWVDVEIIIPTNIVFATKILSLMICGAFAYVLAKFHLQLGQRLQSEAFRRRIIQIRQAVIVGLLTKVGCLLFQFVVTGRPVVSKVHVDFSSYYATGQFLLSFLDLGASITIIWAVLGLWLGKFGPASLSDGLAERGREMAWLRGNG
jgi:hypothetical protein